MSHKTLVLVKCADDDSGYRVKVTTTPIRVYRTRTPDNIQIIDAVNVTDVGHAKELLSELNHDGVLHFDPNLGPNAQFRALLYPVITRTPPSAPTLVGHRLGAWMAGMGSEKEAAERLGVSLDRLKKYRRIGAVVDDRLYVPRQRRGLRAGAPPELTDKLVVTEFEVWCETFHSRADAAHELHVSPSYIYNFIDKGAMIIQDEVFLPYRGGPVDQRTREILSNDDLPRVPDVIRLSDWVQQFPTLAEAAEALEVDQPSLSRHLKTDAVVIGGAIYPPRQRRRRMGGAGSG